VQVIEGREVVVARGEEGNEAIDVGREVLLAIVEALFSL
jgi:hypothetical protein